MSGKTSERLRYWRTKQGLSQAALSKKSGVPQGTISKIEAGKREPSTLLLRLARALRVDPEELIE